MRRLLRFLPFALFVSVIVSATPVAAQRMIDERFAMRPDGSIRVHNLAGSVKVTVWDHDSVAVTGTIFEPQPGDWYFGATPEGAKLGVWTNAPVAGVKPSEFTLQVPRNAQVWVRTASSEILIAGVTGGVDANSVSGRILVTGSPRELYVESLGGELDIDVTTRSLRAKTASGNIRIRGAIRDVTATSVSGNLSIQGDRFERGTFESVDGDIHYIGNIGRTSALDFINHSGAVEFLLAPDAAGEFELNTFQGTFENDLGVRARTQQSKLRGTDVGLTLGSGGGHISVRNFKGRIVLRRKG